MKKREKILPVLFSDPENKIILGRAQVDNTVDTNQVLPQQEAAFHVSAVFILSSSHFRRFEIRTFLF